jgi:hypothetical protein
VAFASDKARRDDRGRDHRKGDQPLRWWPPDGAHRDKTRLNTLPFVEANPSSMDPSSCYRALRVRQCFSAPGDAARLMEPQEDEGAAVLDPYGTRLRPGSHFLEKLFPEGVILARGRIVLPV